ncbi:MAG: outer membrane beta-barrel domain-containing protein [Bdellovibrionales bacterium]|nr:outer membrane beta-barrel domain-containing protein [Bdellovibrionales bacterium]
MRTAVLKIPFIIILSTLGIALNPTPGFSQNLSTNSESSGTDLRGGGESDTPDDEVEDLYDKFEDKETEKKAEKRSSEQKIKATEKAKPDPTTLSELSTLAPLADIAIIQKRFLPKTKRYELSGSVLGTINNPFFLNMGAAIRGGYYFQERYGVELLYFILSSSERAVTDNLRTKRSVKTESLVTPKNFVAVNFKWTPMYGKTTFMNKRIVPFDFYFSGGAGMTSTDQGGSFPTIHLGGGQSFALSKSMAFRWDINWNFYQAESEVLKGGSLQSVKANHDDVYVALGLSFFFPEATYR